MGRKWNSLSVLLVCLILLLTCGLGGQAASNEENITDKTNTLLGSIKSIVTETASISNDEKVRILVKSTEYDHKGNRIQEGKYDENGLIEYQRYWTWNDMDQCIETKHYGKDGNLEYRFEHTYDSLGREIEKATYLDDDTLESRVVSIYDENGNLIDLSHFRGDGSLSMKFLMKYDERGQEIESESYMYIASLTIYFRTVYKYDAYDHQIESLTYGADGSLKDKETWAYDGNGNVFESARYKEGGILDYKFTRSYDSFGRVLAEAFYTQGPLPNIEVLLDKKLYEYDKKGHLICESIYNADNQLTKVYEYEYDSVGNWITKTEFAAIEVAGKTELEHGRVTYRTITYYDL